MEIGMEALPSISARMEVTYAPLCEHIHRVIPDQLLPMKHCFINLSVVNHATTPDDVLTHAHRAEEVGKSVDKGEYERLRQTFNRPRSIEDVHTFGGNFDRILEVSDLHSEGEPVQLSKRILLLGRAGIGKTTLCQNIVYNFTRHGMWRDRFDRVVWIPLRMLRQNVPSNEPLMEFIYTQRFFGDDLKMGGELARQNATDESRVLYVLDGWDEVQGVMHEDRIKEALEQWQDKPFVIVTSRPYTFHNNFQHFDLVLETIGFSEENVLEYIRIVCGDDAEKSASVVKFIQANAGVVAGLASVPILLDILITCSWDSLPQDDPEAGHGRGEEVTMTTLYSQMENYLWLEYVRKSNLMTPEELRNTNKRDKSEVYKLLRTEGVGVEPLLMAKVAHQILQRNEIEFTARDAMRGEDFTHDDRSKWKRTNFLQCLNPVEEEREEMDKTYVFIHLTFQEYFAASFIAQSFRDADREEASRRRFEADLTHKYNPRYSIVWPFVAGLLAGDSPTLERFFDHLERDPTDQLGFAHQHLILNCLNECLGRLTPTRERRLLDELFRFIWAQYCAHGKSLFSGVQLPAPILHRVLDTPDEWWEADAPQFTRMILTHQRHLPQSVLNSLISQLRKKDTVLIRSSKAKLAGLRVQANLSASVALQVMDVIGSILKAYSKTDAKTGKWKLRGNFSGEEAKKVEKWLSVLRNSRLHLTNWESLWETWARLFQCGIKSITTAVIDICLNWPELPIESVRSIVEYNRGRTRQKRVAREATGAQLSVQEMLRYILEDERSYHLETLHKLQRQKEMNEGLRLFAPTQFEKCLNPQGGHDSHLLLRLLISVSPDTLLNDTLMDRLLDIPPTEETWALRVATLYFVGNLKDEVPQSVINKLLNLLTSTSPTGRRKFNVTVSKGDWQGTADFTYLLHLLPLMRFEFYDQHRKRRVREPFRHQRYLTDLDYDLAVLKMVAPDKEQKNAVGHLQGWFQMHQELATIWNSFGSKMASPLDRDLLADPDTFLDHYCALYEQEKIKRDKHEAIFLQVLETEHRIDTQLFWAVVRRHLPLVVLGHHAFNGPYETTPVVLDFEIDYETMECNSTEPHIIHQSEVDVKLDLNQTNELRGAFIDVTARALMDGLAVRALRDTSWPPQTLTDVEQRRLPQVQGSDNASRRARRLLLKAVEYKQLSPPVVSSLVCKLKTMEGQMAEVMSAVLSHQKVNAEDVSTLQAYLFTHNSPHIAPIFNLNPRLLTENHMMARIQEVLGETRDDLCSRRLKMVAVEALRCTQIRDEATLDRIADIFQESLRHMGEPVADKTICFCAGLLLAQNRPPMAQLERLFMNFNPSIAYFYFWMLDSWRVPLSPQIVESLLKLVNANYHQHVSERAAIGTLELTKTSKQLRSILLKQPLANLLHADFSSESRPYQHNPKASVRLKVELIIDKIILDPLPMAIFQQGNQCLFFSPSSVGPQSVPTPRDTRVGEALSIETIKYIHGRNGRLLSLPPPLDPYTRHLRFHTAEENLRFIFAMEGTRNMRTLSGGDLCEFYKDENNRYLRAIRKSAAQGEIPQDSFIDALIGELTTELCTDTNSQWRHLDMRGLHLTDSDLYEIIARVFLKLPKDASLTSLILSDNKVTESGLIGLVKHRLPVKFLFLDRNRIHLSVSHFYTVIKSLIPALDSEEDPIHVDLSLNYIPDTDLGAMAGLVHERLKISREDAVSILTAIRASPFLHSQDLTHMRPVQHAGQDEAVHFDVTSCLCDSEYTNIEPGTTSKDIGCVIVAEKRPEGFMGRVVFRRGHAFLGVEWIPDSARGQKQVLVGELRKYVAHDNQLRIRLSELSPKRLLEMLSPQRLNRDFRRTFEQKDNIAELKRTIEKSRNRAHVYSYSIIASVGDAGNFNCFSWTDAMLLEALHINVDSMRESRITFALGGLIVIVIFVILAILL